MNRSVKVCGYRLLGFCVSDGFSDFSPTDRLTSVVNWTSPYLDQDEAPLGALLASAHRGGGGLVSAAAAIYVLPRAPDRNCLESKEHIVHVVHSLLHCRRLRAMFVAAGCLGICGLLVSGCYMSQLNHKLSPEAI